MKALQDIALADVNADRARREHVDAIRELQKLQPSIVQDVTLSDGVAKEIPHGLGRAPRIVVVSVPRGATSTGRIVESRTGVDRTKAVKLTATGHGSTITVDVEFK